MATSLEFELCCFLFFSMYLPLLKLVCFLFFTSHCVSNLLHFINSIIYGAVLEIFLVIIITGFLTHSGAVLRHLQGASLAILGHSRVGLHARLGTDVRSLIHSANLLILLGAQDLVPVLEHG